MGTIIKNTTSAFVDGQQITSDALNNLIDDAILNTTAVSAGTGLTVNASTGVLSMDTSLTGKTLTGGSLNNCPIGASTPNTGAFTTLSASGGLTGNVTGNVTGGTGAFTTLTASDDVNFDSGTLFVDASADSVGIGTVSPSNTLHIENTTSSGAYINYDGKSNTDFGLRVESNADGGDFESDFGNGSTALLDLYANSATVSGGDLLVARTQSATPVLLVKGNGNVGIGSSAPDKRLVVAGVGSEIVIDDTDATDTPRLRFRESGSTSGSVSTDAGELIFDSGTTERMRIDSSGNVGIGDNTPSYKLDVNGTGRFVGQLTLDDELLHNISGTQTRFPGYYAGTYGVELEQAAQGSTVHIGRSNGNCMNIGADATAAGTDVNVVYFRDTGAGVGGPPAVSTEVGKIVIDTTSTSYSTSSDYRLKENEVVISDGIDRLKQLTVYRFNFINEPSKVVDGFFAHEVSPVVPESIVGTKDEVDGDGNPVYQGIDQSKLVPLLTAALQEAVAKIEALEARVQTLEG